MSTEPVRVGLMVGREWSFPPAFIEKWRGATPGSWSST